MKNAFPFLPLAALWLAPTLPAFGAPDTPKIVETKFPTDDYLFADVSVTDAPFSAPTDGVTDATAAFQAAIDAVKAKGGGVVYAPAGRYLFKGNLTLKEGVTLRGDWKRPGAVAAVGGTVLMPTAGRGEAEGTPFISMQRGTGVRSLNFWYPEQSADNIAAYPWTLDDDPKLTGNNFTIQQVTLVNSYQGIRLGPEFSELFTVRDVYGTPLKLGIQFDNISDIGRILYTKFGPKYWLESGLGTKPDAAKLKNYLFTQGTAIEMRRSDWQYFYDVTLEGYARGLWVHKGEQGAPIGVATRLKTVGCDVGFLMEETRMAVVDCQFEGTSAAVSTSANFTNDLQLVNCTLKASNGPAIRNLGSGAVRLINSKLSGKGPAVVATQGQITLIGSQLPKSGTQVQLDKMVSRALLVGNNISKAQVSNNSRYSDVNVDTIPLTSPDLKLGDVKIPADRKPATSQLFDVRDYGAQPGKSDTQFDNTAAFQKALDAAGKAGGGTVYVPAGFYRFSGHLSVPTGVEVRGVFDVPHHTVSLGSVLMPTEGRGNENGTPFIALQTNSGLRGLTVWYPEQYTDDIAPYPWTVRSMGRNCWMMDVTTANSYNYVDFGSYPSDGHLLRYVAGSPLRRGVYVSKGSGTIDSCQFNPHYWVRRTDASPRLLKDPRDTKDAFKPLMDFILQNHDAFIIGSSPRELQLNNFVYGSSNGLRFVADNGKSGGGIVINHATDGASEGVRFDSIAPTGVDVLATQIAVVGAYPRYAVRVAPENTGPVNIWGGYSFASESVPTMELFGQGATQVQGWHSSQSEIVIGGGVKRLEGMSFTKTLPVAVKVQEPVTQLELIGNNASNGIDFNVAPKPAKFYARANSHAVPEVPLVTRFVTSFGPNDPKINIRASANSHMTDAKAEVVAGAGRDGSAALVLSGTPDPNEQSLAYFKIYDVNLEVKPDTVLRYWIRPENKGSMFSGIDFDFTEGAPMRDSGGPHPASARGAAGYWTQFEFKVGEKMAGRTIKDLLFAFDQKGIKELVKVAVDRIEIGEPVY